MLNTSSNSTTLDPAKHTDSPSIKVEYHGFVLDLGEASDRLLDCFIRELSAKLTEMIERNNKHGWASGPASFEYAKSQVHYHLRGLIKEQARRLANALSTPPVMALMQTGGAV